MAKSHAFNFDGGDELNKMSATWFVSYLFYQRVDKSHRNWECISTRASRASVFGRTAHYHEDWLRKVLCMNDSKLNINAIGLKAAEIKGMAKKILEHGL